MSSWWLSEGFRPIHLFFAIVLVGGPIVAYLSHEMSALYHRPPASFSDLGRADPTEAPTPSPIAGTRNQPTWHPPFVAPTPTKGRQKPPPSNTRQTGRPGQTSPTGGTSAPPIKDPTHRPPSPPPTRTPEPEPTQPAPEPSTNDPVPQPSTGALPETSPKDAPAPAASDHG